MSYTIIGVHGLANKPPRARHELDWVKAITEGLQRNSNVSLTTLNFRLVYWADVLYQQPVVNDEEPYQQAASTGPLTTYKDGWRDEVRATLSSVGGKAFDAAKRWLGIDTVADVVLQAKLEDLAKYYEDATIRNELRKRLREVITAEKDKRLMVIAHSMGSIIGYDVLRELGKENTPIAIDHFITIGSPLGLPHVKLKIFEKNQALRSPSIVRQWTNLADRRDPVAFDTHLGDDYEANDRGVAVRDDLIINSYKGPTGKTNYHKIYGYLRAPELSDLVRKFI